MARPGISQQDVFDAADSLMNEGQAVNVNSVRDRIGSGSFTTINAYLAKWREENNGKKRSDVPEPPLAVVNAIRQLWAVAWNEAQDRIKVEREALEIATRQMDQERNDMAAEIGRLEELNARQSAELARLTDQLAARNGAVSTLEREKASLSTQVARLEERVKASEALAAERKDQLDKLMQRIPAVNHQSAPAGQTSAPQSPAVERKKLRR